MLSKQYISIFALLFKAIVLNKKDTPRDGEIYSIYCDCVRFYKDNAVPTPFMWRLFLDNV